MAISWLHDANLVDPETGTIEAGAIGIEHGRIAAVIRGTSPVPTGETATSLAGARVAPGFVDVHYHGALPGCDPDDAAAALIAASASLVRHGVTAFLATTVAWPATDLAKRVSRLAAVLAEGAWPGAIPIGLHLEGPWIRPEAAGAQPPQGIRPYEAREGAELFDRIGSLLRLVTLAPELEGARLLERELARRGVAIALGHTLADESSLRASVANGACHVTHLFNAMGCRSHREARRPGAEPEGFARLALGEEALGCDLIADGAHVHSDWLRLAAEAKRERTLLISDRIDVGERSAGWLGADRMRSDGVAWRLPNGRLAGSLLTLDAAIRNAERMRVMPFHDAVGACTIRPARLIGAERERGTLRVGARADLVALDASGAVLRTWVGGRQVWAADAATSESR